MYNFEGRVYVFIVPLCREGFVYTHTSTVQVGFGWDGIALHTKCIHCTRWMWWFRYTDINNYNVMSVSGWLCHSLCYAQLNYCYHIPCVYCGLFWCVCWSLIDWIFLYTAKTLWRTYKWWKVVPPFLLQELHLVEIFLWLKFDQAVQLYVHLTQFKRSHIKYMACPSI